MRALREHAAVALAAPRRGVVEAHPGGEPILPLAQALPQLLDLLRAFDLRAAERFAALSPQLRRQLGSAVHTRLKNQMDKLEFGGAVELLEAIDL